MLPLLVWITPRIGTFRYKGKEYELNDYYSQLKRKIEGVRIISSIVLLVIAFFLPLPIGFGYLFAGILLFGYFFALLFYELLFPNDIEKIARVL